MTNAEARFNKSLRPRKPEGSLGRTAQDVHLDSHTAPEKRRPPNEEVTIIYLYNRVGGGGGGREREGKMGEGIERKNKREGKGGGGGQREGH